MKTDEISDMPALVDGGRQRLTWLRRMRAEQPLWVGPHGVHHVFSYADVQAVLADPTRLSSNLGRVMPFVDKEKAAATLIWADPPVHRGLRQLVSAAFTPKAVARLRSRIEAITGELLADLPDGEFDLVEGLGYPLPLTVIAELLGVSAADREFFRRCAESAFGIRVDRNRSEAELAAVVADATRELDDYLVAEARRRRANPADDLLGELTTAEIDGRRLTDVEVAAFGTLLLNAGYITSTLLLGNTFLCLRDHPAVEAELRANRSLIPVALDEVLCVRPPFPQIYRIALQDVPIAGGIIPGNSFVMASVLSANHDEHQFVDPEAFDIRRDPNRQLAFGHGIHFCLGAPLASLEVEIAINALFTEFAELGVSGRPVWQEAEFYGAKQLPVSARRH